MATLMIYGLEPKINLPAKVNGFLIFNLKDS